MTDVYVPDQIAAVYFDSSRDFKTPIRKPDKLHEFFSFLIEKKPAALSIGSADRYLQHLGYHPQQVEVFRSYVDQAVMKHLSAQEPRGICCEFSDRYYLGLHMDKQCFSLSPNAVRDMRKDFIHSLNAARTENYKLLWTNCDDFDCRRAPTAQMEIA